jgi:hypothetical protein
MRILPLMLLALVIQSADAQQSRVINYKEDKNDFPNPERGFYVPIGTRAGDFKPLDSTTLHQIFPGAHKAGKQRYTVHSTLLMREYTLDAFRTKPLSDEFLRQLEQDFNTVREAGIKLVLRFAYINQAKNGDCPDVYKICPPYGDASKAIVLRHIAQLAPVLRRNADLIAVLQEGFIGIWGENFYTDYFGDPGKNGPGRIMDSSWNDRNEVLHALLGALPDDRMIQVRTPQIKQKYVFGPSAPISSPTISATQAYTGADISRIGFHNDCFLASPDDYGTYYDYGSSNSPQQEANTPLREYLKRDSRYVPVGGETCDDAFSPQNDCAPFGHAEEEMADMHYSFLNCSYNNDVNNDWDSLGCIGSIRQRLGYRFILQTGRFPAKAAPGAPFVFTIKLRNAGYASPFNPRPVHLVFRNKATGAEYKLSAHADPRTWFPGEQTWTDTLALPRDMPAGNYDVLLAFPDKSDRLAANPAYSIRLANADTWEPATGYNRLGAAISVGK